MPNSSDRRFDATLLDGLMPPQVEAVTHVDGPLLVLAGPGSGKTTVVTRRVAHLIGQGVPPWQILALTFTNKAAGEMAERVDTLLPENLAGRRGLTIATFHSFCARLLRRYAPEAGIAERFSIYDSGDQKDAIKRAISEAELNERNFSRGAVGAAISNAKNLLLDAEAYAEEANDFYTRAMSRAYKAYQRILKANDALDFDDLLLLTAQLLRNNDGVRSNLQERYEYILVDEYQDTNHAQFVIADELAAGHRNICVVGDPDQSIYGWRGADIRNILEFEKQYPEAKVIPLGQNFRSTGHIVAAADHLIQHNAKRKHKPLHTELGDGEKPVVQVCLEERHEAAAIADAFRHRHEEDGIAWKDMAVLYRMNALSRVLEDAFRDRTIPYVIARGTAFYERKEIKDALAYLRLIVNPNDEVALRRIVNTPTRGIGKKTIDCVDAHAAHHGMRFADALRHIGLGATVEGLSARATAAVAAFARKLEEWRELAGDRDATPDGGDAVLPMELPSVSLAELVERVVHESGLEKLYRNSRAEEDLERLENLEELVSAAAQFVPKHDDSVDFDVAGEGDAPPPEPSSDPVTSTVLDRLAAWLESVALVSDADAVDPANGAVTLMTLHAAKGLEFDTVAMVGLEEGLLPHYRAAESEAQLEEERRLCFVGITRARRRLVLSRARTRTHRGMRERTIESQFLRELPAECIDTDEPFDTGFETESYDQRPRTGLVAGAIVRHPTFGMGRVESITPRPAGSSARVTFQSVGMKTLILEYANLECVELNPWE